MKRLVALASFALFAAAPLAPAHANTGKELKIIFGIAASELLSQSGVNIRQSGDGNGAAASQTGPNNTANIDQLGNRQTAKVDQAGRSNRSSVSQYGIANTGAVNQSGKSNYACLIQVGVGLNAEVNQTGRRRAMGVLQTPNGAQEISPAMCFIEKVGRKYVEQRLVR